MAIDTKTYNIKVDVQTQYIPDQSDPEQERYVFAYTITIHNTGQLSANDLLVNDLLTAGFEVVPGALNLRVVRNIMLSWVVTLPAGGILSILFFFLLKGIFYSGPA